MNGELRFGVVALIEQKLLQGPGPKKRCKACKFSQRKQNSRQLVLGNIGDDPLFGFLAAGFAKTVGREADGLSAQLVLAELGQRAAFEMAELGLAAVHHRDFRIVQKHLHIAYAAIQFRRQGVKRRQQKRFRIQRIFRNRTLKPAKLFGLFIQDKKFASRVVQEGAQRAIALDVRRCVRFRLSFPKGPARGSNDMGP